MGADESYNRVKLLIFIFNLVRNSWSIVAARLVSFSFFFVQLHNHRFLHKAMKCLLQKWRKLVSFTIVHLQWFSGILCACFFEALSSSSLLKLWPSPLPSRSFEFMLHETKAKISNYVMTMEGKILVSASSSDSLTILQSLLSSDFGWFLNRGRNFLESKSGIKILRLEKSASEAESCKFQVGILDLIVT